MIALTILTILKKVWPYLLIVILIGALKVEHDQVRKGEVALVVSQGQTKLAQDSYNEMKKDALTCSAATDKLNAELRDKSAAMAAAGTMANASIAQAQIRSQNMITKMVTPANGGLTCDEEASKYVGYYSARRSPF